MKKIFLILLAAALWLPVAEARHHRRPSRKSPHQEVTASARVATAPRRATHANRREFEEFDVVVLSAAAAPEGDRDPDSALAVDRTSSVHVVHDLSCGGTWVDLRPGDLVDLKGEYVQVGAGRNLIHFTHPAGGACGNGEPHPDGYLKRHDAR